MASFNSPGTGEKLVNTVLTNPNPNAKQYVMKPVAGLSSGQKNIHTPKSRKESKK